VLLCPASFRSALLVSVGVFSIWPISRFLPVETPLALESWLHSCRVLLGVSLWRYVFIVKLLKPSSTCLVRCFGVESHVVEKLFLHEGAVPGEEVPPSDPGVSILGPTLISGEELWRSVVDSVGDDLEDLPLLFIVDDDWFWCLHSSHLELLVVIWCSWFEEGHVHHRVDFDVRWELYLIGVR